MPKLNLKTASFANLVSMRDEIQAALSERIDGERAALQKRMDELAALEGGHAAADRSAAVGRKKLGVRPSAKSTGKRHGKVEAKYGGPDGETWSGRGLTPRWLTALEKQGKKRDSFLIEK